jgi:hypothetical protein
LHKQSLCTHSFLFLAKILAFGKEQKKLVFARLPQS